MFEKGIIQALVEGKEKEKEKEEQKQKMIKRRRVSEPALHLLHLMDEKHPKIHNLCVPRITWSLASINHQCLYRHCSTTCLKP